MPLVLSPATAAALDEAVAILRSDRVVAFPTDTLYALAAAADSDVAVRRVFALKGRDPDKPLPLLVDSLAMAERVAIVDDQSRRLIEAFWPGALTLVLPVRAGFRSLALAGGDTVALRAPDLPLALRLIGALGQPVTGTSANRSGGSDPDSAEAVISQLGDDVDLVLDGGRCPGGVASTIIELVGGELRIVRAGGLAEDRVRAALAATS
jgi:L-threonylcarbamoyladenylate synthase